MRLPKAANLLLILPTVLMVLGMAVLSPFALGSYGGKTRLLQTAFFLLVTAIGLLALWSSLRHTGTASRVSLRTARRSALLSALIFLGLCGFSLVGILNGHGPAPLVFLLILAGPAVVALLEVWHLDRP